MMAFQIDRPIVFFDLEATGLNPKADRIVEVAMVKRLLDGGREEFSALVNPEIPIPQEASAVHRITDGMVAREKTFPELAPELVRFLDDCDLGGFGVLKYDIPLLEAELARSGFDLRLKSRRVVDALSIYHRMEPRNLAAAYRLYCGRALPVAHRALPDAQASLDVFLAQLERYGELPQDMEGMSFFCREREGTRLDPEGRLVWRNGELYLNFGKHRMRTLRQVASQEPSYLNWLASSDSTPSELSAIYREALRGRFPAPPAAPADHKP